MASSTETDGQERERLRRLGDLRAPELREYQAMGAAAVAALLRDVDRSIVARHGATGTVGPHPPLYFETTRWAERGEIRELSDTDHWVVGVDAESRVVREGPQQVYVYPPSAILSLNVQSKGTFGGVGRMDLDDSGNVVSRVTLATGGGEINVYTFERVDGRVSRMLWWSSRVERLYDYRAEYTDDGLVDVVTLQPSHVVFRRPTTPRDELYSVLEADLKRLIDDALRASGVQDRPLYAIILHVEGVHFPPALFLGSNRVRCELGGGEISHDDLWNPLLDSLPHCDGTPSPEARALAEELCAEEIEAFSSQVRGWAKRWTAELRERAETTDEFVVLPYNPEHEVADTVLAELLSESDMMRLRGCGLLPPEGGSP